MPEDKRFDMVRNLFYRPRDHHHDHQHDYVDDFDKKVNDELWEKYHYQSTQSQGFDIVDYPFDGCGIITPMFNNTCPVNAKTYHMLSDCSRMAVDAYNQREGTDYTVNRVTKVCAQLVAAGMMYFITFEAINSSHHHNVFQAKVYAPPMMGAKEVVLVRPKA
ncbi:hypothetical protein LIER_02217 [Lithospermum erythrorhizon]|uniref:Cystatin domain-containing protein n=1 Tax=Lithospermum erythrorhizon TaxID=34254 RepID=A0AAV3NTD4_LITER